MNGCGCVPAELYLQKQAVGWFWPKGHSFSIPILKHCTDRPYPWSRPGNTGHRSGGTGTHTWPSPTPDLIFYYSSPLSLCSSLMASSLLSKHTQSPYCTMAFAPAAGPAWRSFFSDLFRAHSLPSFCSLQSQLSVRPSLSRLSKLTTHRKAGASSFPPLLLLSRPLIAIGEFYHFIEEFNEFLKVPN